MDVFMQVSIKASFRTTFRLWQFMNQKNKLSILSFFGTSQ